MRKLLLASTALAFGVASNAAFAQTASQDSVEDDDSQENQIIVTARLRDESLIEVPLSVSVTSAEQLNRDQIFTLTDLQRITPALQVNSGFGGDLNGGAGIRGIRTQAFNPSVAPSVAIVVDQAAAGNVNFPILHDLAQVEVLRGPQGTLFGQGASAGVINVSTVAPEIGEFRANFNLDYADDGTAGSEQTEIVARGGVSIPLGDKAAMRIAGFYKQEVGVRTNTFLNNRDDQSDEYAIRARLLVEPTDTIRIHLIGDYAKIDEDGVRFMSPLVGPQSPINGAASQANLTACGVTPDLISRRGRFFCEDVPSQESREILSLTGIIEADLSDNLSLTSVTSYRDQGVDVVRRNFSIRAIGRAARDENLRNDFQQFTQELRLGYQGNGFDIVAGAYYADFSYARTPLDPSLPLGDTRQGFRTGFSVCTPNGASCGVPVTFVPETIDNRTIAVFADATIDLSDTVELFGGLRYTDYSNDNGFGINTLEPTGFGSLEETNLSGRIGLSYRPNPDTTIYGSYARGYKPGALAFPGDPRDPFIALDPEENSAFEIGAKTMVGRVQLDVNAFYMNVANFQGQTSESIGGELVSFARSLGDVESYGIEVMASGQLTEKLSINAGYIFNPVTYDEGFIGDDGSDLSGQQLLSAPRHKIVVSGEYVEPLNNSLDFFTSANLIYRSEVLTNNRDPERFVFPAGEFVNLRAGVRHPDGNWTASIFVRNLTQTREPAATLPLNFQGNDDLSVRGVPIAGLTTRVVGASVGFNF